jgi:hypothetical protein
MLKNSKTRSKTRNKRDSARAANLPGILLPVLCFLRVHSLLLARATLFHSTPFTVAARSVIWVLINTCLLLLPVLLLWILVSYGGISALLPESGSIGGVAFTLAYISFGTGLLLLVYGEYLLPSCLNY